MCDLCFDEHQLHDIIPFSKIGFTENELNEIKKKMEKIDEQIKNYNEKKKEIENLISNISSIQEKEYNLIYDNDRVNNYKQYYINYLEAFQEQIKKVNELNLLTIEKNYIVCEYTIQKDKKSQKILSSIEESRRNGLKLMKKEMKMK